MLLDLLSTFNNDTALTATAISDVIDLGASPTLRNLGAGQPIYLVGHVGTTFTAAGAATLDSILDSDSTADLATSATTHITIPQIAVATLVSGYSIIKQALPIEETYERFLGMRNTVGTGPFTAGKLTFSLTDRPEAYTTLPDPISAP